jgi:hypothetical protein
MFLQNIFKTETNNYIKRILQTHTDHYHKTMATNLKKLNTQEVNKLIACHRSKQIKNKSHVLVCKTHHIYDRSSITFPRDNFQLNLTCFHKVAKTDFVTVLGACWRSVVFITPTTIRPRQRTLVSAEKVLEQT